MSDISIRADGLGKQYRLGANKQGYKSLRDTVSRGVRQSLSKLRTGGRRGSQREMLWALKDVSFSIRQGEVIGIIGRNGAGKSTLLKVLSRITEPSEGSVDLWGRVGSLLEVGTGFHPELTGRENIYLSGAILGMKRAEIVRQFDEMVAFAEVEKFVDTPVKHYSSGMYLRLAFAVAAHLEPEILMVDEVLAVGDARFQRKCLDKMQEVGQQGRTVLFVSHNMPLITRLCPRALLFSDGRLAIDGPSPQVVSQYLNSDLGTTAAREWGDRDRAPASDVVRLRAVRVRLADGTISETIDIREPVGVELEYDVLKPGFIIFPNYAVFTAEGIMAFSALDQDPVWRGRRRPVGRYVTTGWIPGNLLSEGIMLIGVWMRTLEPDYLCFYEKNIVSFQVIDVPNGDTARGDFTLPIPGAVRPLLRWTTEQQPPSGSRSAQPAAIEAPASVG
jgi:lipopolysaccharide transport system ATP-binding protein